MIKNCKIISGFMPLTKTNLITVFLIAMAWGIDLTGSTGLTARFDWFDYCNNSDNSFFVIFLRNFTSLLPHTPPKNIFLNVNSLEYFSPKLI